VCPSVLWRRDTTQRSREMRELIECGYGWVGAVVVPGFTALGWVAGRWWQRRLRMTLAFMHVSKARFEAGAGRPCHALTTATASSRRLSEVCRFIGPGACRGCEECFEQQTFHARGQCRSVFIITKLRPAKANGNEHDRHPSETLA
jgi:hypothetical protein